MALNQLRADQLYTGSLPSFPITSSWAIEAVSASYSRNAQSLNNTSSNIFATTGSNVFDGNQLIKGNLNIEGNLVAEQFIISSSISYFTSSFFNGSTKFGDSISDTHQFTGSILSNGTSSFSYVGIGTTTPIQKLEIKDGNLYINQSVTGSSVSSSYIEFSQNLGDNTVANKIKLYNTSDWVAGLGVSPNDFDYFTGDNHRFYVGTTKTVNGTEIFTILKTGKVGINNTNPSYTLDVGGNLNLAEGIYHYIGSNKFVKGDGSSYVQLFTGTNNLTVRNNSDTSDLLVIENGGSVGINVSNPTNTLDVGGNISASCITASILLANLSGSVYGTS